MQRQFDEQMAFERSQSTGGGVGGLTDLFGDLTGGTGAGGQQDLLKDVPKGMADLAQKVFVKSDGQFWSDDDLRRDYERTLESAGYGNQRDKRKLELYHTVRPDIFGEGIPAQALGNYGVNRGGGQGSPSLAQLRY